MSHMPADIAELPTDLLRQAAQWRLLGLMFEPPEGGWRDELRLLAAEVGDEGLAAAAVLAQEEADPELYHSAFGPGGPVCPREVSHHVTMVPGGLLSELEAYYAAFGYQPMCRETPDHVAVEIGFIAFLRLKQAYAHACGETGQADLAAEAAGRFLSEHLAVSAEPLAGALRRSGIAYLGAAAEWLQAHAGPAIQLPLITPEPWDEADEHIECV